MNFSNDAKTDIQEVIQEQDPGKKKDLYNQYTDEHTPKKSWMWNTCKAFFVGGAICTLGQCFTNWFKHMGYGQEAASMYTTLCLILLSVIFTGLNLYQKLANWAGAGTIVPITGFANSVAAPAIEFQNEGMVMGVGAKIFTIAGPVILYGIFTSWVLGVCYWVWSVM